VISSGLFLLIIFKGLNNIELIHMSFPKFCFTIHLQKSEGKKNAIEVMHAPYTKLHMVMHTTYTIQ